MVTIEYHRIKDGYIVRRSFSSIHHELTCTYNGMAIFNLLLKVNHNSDDLYISY